MRTAPETKMPHPYLVLSLLGPAPSAKIEGAPISLETKYCEIVCYLAVQGGEADLRSLCRAIYRPVDPVAANKAVRNIRSIARGRTPSALWRAAGYPTRPEAATYLIFKGPRIFLGEVSCDLIDLWNDGQAALALRDPEKAKEWIKRGERSAQAGTLIECGKPGEDWDGRWLPDVRRKWSEMFDRLRELSAHAPISDRRPDPPRGDSNFARLQSEPERVKDALKALAVLPDACSIQALRSIAGWSDLSVEELGEPLKNRWVELKSGKPEPRYSLNAALSRILMDERRSEELDPYRARHRDHFLKVVERCAKDLRHPDSSQSREELRLEYPHIRAAIDWSLEKKHPQALSFCFCLQNYWRAEPDLAAALECCEEILSRVEWPASEALARAYKCAGVLAYYSGLKEVSHGYYTKCTVVWGRTGAGGDAKGLVDASNDLALLMLETAEPGSVEYERAGTRLEGVCSARSRASAAAEDLEARIRLEEGLVAGPKGAAIKAAREEWRERKVEEAVSLYNLSVFHYYKDEHRKRRHSMARKSLLTSLEISRLPDVGYTEGQALCNLVFGKCCLSEARYEEAQHYLQRSLDLFANEFDDVLPQIEALESAAYLFARTQRCELAVRLLAQSDRKRIEHEYYRNGSGDAEYRKYIAPMIMDQGQERYDRWYADPGFGGFQEAVQHFVKMERFEMGTP